MQGLKVIQSKVQEDNRPTVEKKTKRDKDKIPRETLKTSEKK